MRLAGDGHRLPYDAMREGGLSVAHRIELGPNAMAPLALWAENPSPGRLEPFDPAREETFDPFDSFGPQHPATVNPGEPVAGEELAGLGETGQARESGAFSRPTGATGENWQTWASGESCSSNAPSGLELIAVDQAVPPSPSYAIPDALWLSAAFSGPHGRTVAIHARGAAGPPDPRAGCRGVLMNSYDHTPLPGGQPLWYARPLLAWGRFDVEVDGELTDESMLGRVELFHHPLTGRPALSFTVYPRRVGGDGTARWEPFHAAEEMGMAGWRLRWPLVEYRQAPVARVRIERGDTLESIAEEFSVDPILLRRVNRHIEDPSSPPRGETLAVPLLTGHAARRKRRHRSTALSWLEIVRGWTALN